MAEQKPVKVVNPPKSHPLVVLPADEFVAGFVKFLRDHAIVGIAIGFTIGFQAQALVKQLNVSIFDPVFQLIFGTSITNSGTVLHIGSRVARFQWGGLLYALLDFTFVLLIVYLIVKVLKLDRFDKQIKKGEQHVHELKR